MRLNGAALYLGCEGRGVLLGMEGAPRVSINCNDAAGSEHFEL